MMTANWLASIWDSADSLSSVITKANWGIAATLLCGCIFTAISIVASNRKDSLLKHVDLERAEKIAQLEVSAAQLKGQNLNLEIDLARIRARMAPRALSKEQMDGLSTIARGFAGQVLEVTRYSLSREAQELSEQIETSLKRGGWQVRITGTMGGAEAQAGIYFLVEKNNQSKAADAVVRFLSDQGYAAAFSASDGFRPIPIPKGTVLLFVGPKS